MDRKEISVTFEPTTMTVPEEWSEEEITAYLSNRFDGVFNNIEFKNWKYLEEWRN